LFAHEDLVSTFWSLFAAATLLFVLFHGKKLIEKRSRWRRLRVNLYKLEMANAKQQTSKAKEEEQVYDF